MLSILLRIAPLKALKDFLMFLENLYRCNFAKSKSSKVKSEWNRGKLYRLL